MGVAGLGKRRDRPHVAHWRRVQLSCVWCGEEWTSTVLDGQEVARCRGCDAELEVPAVEPAKRRQT